MTFGRSLLICMVAIALLNSGVATAKDKKTDKAGTESLLKNPEARAYVMPQCFISTNPAEVRVSAVGADIGAAFIGKAIDMAYSSIVSALKRAGEDKNLEQKFASVPFYLYTAEKKPNATDLIPKYNLGCVVLVYGEFEKDESSPIQLPRKNPPESCVDECKKGSPAADCAKCLRTKNGIGVTKLGLAYEASVSTSEDQSAFVYASRYLRIENWLQAGRKDREHSYAITLTLLSPSSRDDDKVVSTAILDLGTRERNSVYGPGELFSHSGWLSSSGFSNLDKERLQALLEKKGTGIMHLGPMTLHASINETAKGSPVAAKLAELMAGAQKDVVGALSKAASPVEIAAAKDKQASDLEKARTAEEQAYSMLLQAKIDRGRAPTKEEKAKAKFDEQTAGRAWCREVGLLQTFGVAPPVRDATCPYNAQ